jgi:hypothetical protein
VSATSRRPPPGISGLILGETVYLEGDQSDRDQFGRLLRYVGTETSST